MRWVPDAWTKTSLPRGRHPLARHLPPRLRRHRAGAAPGRARQRAALDRRPALVQRQQHQRLPQYADRGARRRRRAPGLRQLERDLRRPSGAAQGGARHRPAAVALRPDQGRQRAVRRRVRRVLRLPRHRPALLQRVRAAPEPRRRVLGGDLGLDRRAAARPDRLRQRRRQERPRLLLRRQRGAGEPARRHGGGRRRHQPGLQHRARRADHPQRAVRDDQAAASCRACRT